MCFIMDVLLLSLLGLVAFCDAQLPTVRIIFRNSMWQDNSTNSPSQVLSPEPTGVPGINKTVPIINGTVPSGVAIHDHGGPICPPYYDDWAMANPIHDGIMYLRGKADCTAAGVPGCTWCQRVSCSYNSAIFVCNTNYATPVSPPATPSPITPSSSSTTASRTRYRASTTATSRRARSLTTITGTFTLGTRTVNEVGWRCWVPGI
ncbi:hypothetical protein PG993_011757 [Apiospora rasikravindrae]|uniref:Uncharacterized protein n=1 Tax=Apiospora rasikravindrae TaxID=990691 RepID=A0ABR1S246_9PEZI